LIVKNVHTLNSVMSTMSEDFTTLRMFTLNGVLCSV